MFLIINTFKIKLVAPPTFVLLSFLFLNYYLSSHRRWYSGLYSCHILLSTSLPLLCFHPNLSTTHLARQSPNHPPQYFSPPSISYHNDKIICLIIHFCLWTYGNHTTSCSHGVKQHLQVWHMYGSTPPWWLLYWPKEKVYLLNLIKTTLMWDLGLIFGHYSCILCFLDAYNFFPWVINAWGVGMEWRTLHIWGITNKIHHQPLIFCLVLVHGDLSQKQCIQ